MLFRQRRATALGLLLAAVACSGVACGEGGTPAQIPVRVDSAGVEIVSSARPLHQDGACRLGEPSLDLSRSGGASSAEFHRIADLIRVGRTLVVAGPHGVRGFSSGGEELWQFGREGDGPREFRRITDLEARGDSVVVFDHGRRRVSILDPAGRWVRGFPLGVEFPAPDLAVLGGEGLVLATSFPSVLVEDVPLGLTRVPTAILRVSWSGVAEDTVGRTAGHESVRLESEHGIIDQRPIFGHTSHVAVRDDGIIVGDGTFLGVEELTPDGALRRIVRGEVSLALTPDLLAAEWEAREGVLGPEATRRLRETTPVPDTRPAYSRLLISGEGELWLKEHRGEFMGFVGTDPQRWQVFDAEGVWLGSCEMPTAFRPTEIGADGVLGVFVDDLDVEHPQLRPILRPGSATPAG